jgi:hypothetical protein
MSGETARFLEFSLFFVAAIGWCAWEIWTVHRSQRQDRGDK